MRLSKIIPQDDLTLHVTAEDGRSGLFDVSPYLDSEAFAPLKESTKFKHITNGVYFVEWDCGADLSADTIEARWHELPLSNNQRHAG